MKIIVLQQKSNTGKTTVITKLYHKLSVSYKKLAFKKENDYEDFSAVFRIGEHVIGITSIGDSAKDLKNAFDFFEKHNCELVVVCCHKKNDGGRSKEFIITKALEYKTEIVWSTKAYLQQWNTLYEPYEEIDVINDIQARILLQEILLRI